MKTRLYIATSLIIFSCLIAQSSHACTTLFLDKGNQLVVGANFDWMVPYGLVVINKQNVSKKAMLHPEWGTGKKASWTSKYGSVTFNFASREIAWGGMNEAGLVAASMMLDAANIQIQIRVQQYLQGNGYSINRIILAQYKKCLPVIPK